MVACAAVSSHSHVLLAVPMTACALTVDQLKQQLLSAIENGTSEALSEALANLEKAPINKEILQSTRIGATVNDVRKRIVDQWPEVSKRCRSLIKSWQRLVEARPSSSTSSANATPSLVSPGAAKLARTMTPSTPVTRRVTSTGVSTVNGRSTTVSPANGSYAPKDMINGSLHKSQSVGTELLAKGDESRGQKRKLEEANATIKRTKTAVGSLSSTPSSVSAARMNVQRTTDLVAELSQNLPEHMSIDSSIRQHEEKVKREQQDEELAMQLNGGPAVSPYVLPERKKRKYERKIKPETPVEPVDERRGGLILRLPRLAPVKEDAEAAMEPGTSTSRPSSSASVSRPESRLGTTSTKKVDWLAMVPSLAELKIRADEHRAARTEITHDPTKVYLMKVNGRDVLALPYLDVSSRPDFIKYKYPEPAQYYAEENFAYGAERIS